MLGIGFIDVCIFILSLIISLVLCKNMQKTFDIDLYNIDIQAQDIQKNIDIINRDILKIEEEIDIIKNTKFVIKPPIYIEYLFLKNYKIEDIDNKKIMNLIIESLKSK